MESFGEKLRIAVIGASGGIGGALVRHLSGDDRVAEVFAFARSEPGSAIAGPRVTLGQIDIEREDSIATAAEVAGPVHVVLVATGILHDSDGLQPEKNWRALDAEALLRAYRINAVGPALIAKHFLPRLPRERRTAFAALSARVGSIGDNRLGGWHAYRASKAALNMLIRTLAIELARNRPRALCVGLHPGTVDTALSLPFQRGVPPEKLFAPDAAAARLLSVLDGLEPADSGHLFAWDGARIPF